MKGMIRTAADRDLGAVKKMTDCYIGKDFYTLPELKEITGNPNRSLLVYADEEDRAVAYLYFFTAAFRDALDMLHIPPEMLERLHISRDIRVGVYKTACTEEDLRGKGILTAFLHESEEILRKKKVNWILLTALQTPNHNVPVHKAVTDRGFWAVGTLKRPWIHINAYCPYCGKQYCICNGVVYVKPM